MDSISLKLIDRTILKKESMIMAHAMKIIKLQNDELNIKFEVSAIQAEKYKKLWTATESQKDKLFTSLELQKTIADNIKKKHLKIVSYTLEEESLLVWLSLPC